MLISNAFAQAADAAPSMDGMRTMVQLVLIFVIFYFLLIRPQQKRAKTRDKMLSVIDKGNKVVFGGIEGVVKKVINENEMMVEIAPNVEVKVLRQFISEVVLPPSLAQDKKESKGK